MMPPEIYSSTREERENYIKEKFACKHNCEICGLCQVFKGKEPEAVYRDYIEGIKDYAGITEEYRR